MRARLLPAFRRLHRWIGLVLALPLLLEGASGAFLVGAEALDDWRAPRLAAPAGAADASGIIATALRVAGSGLVAAGYTAPEGRSPALVELARPGARGAALRLWIDPATQTVMAQDAGAGGLARWMRGFHENLFLPFGRNLLGWAGVGVVLMAITGLLLWWPPRGRRLAALGVSRRARGARLARELHGAVAIWLLLPLLAQSVTGIPLGFPASARALAGLGPMRFAGTRGRAPEPLDLAAVIARAAAAMPDAHLAELRLPTMPGRPVFVRMRRDGASDGAPSPFIAVAPDGSRVISAEDPSRSTGASLLGWNRRLHGMEAGGPVWHLLQFLAGLALPLLSLTGCLLWAMRRLRRSAQARRATLAAE